MVNNIGAGFGFPPRYKVIASNRQDFSRSQVLADQSKADLPNPGLAPVAHEVRSSARYIRIAATRLAPRSNDYIFALAEVQVLDALGENRANKAKVTALDSIEAPSRWRKSNLTDGIWAKEGDPEAAGELAGLNQEKTRLLDKACTPERKARLAELDKSIRQAAENLKKLPVGRMVYAAATEFKNRGNFKPTNGKPRPIRILHRGDVTQPRAEVRPGTLPLFPNEPWQFELTADHDESDRRAALAGWLVREDHPLTWRVIANRVWQWHFGNSLVASPNDFGRLGQMPSHPELLDWLAIRFRDNGGTFKDFHRLLLHSATYRQASMGQSSEARRKAEAVDSGNRLHWKMNRRRLSAEEVRDSILAASGKLNPKMGGPGFYLFKLEKTAHSPHYEYHKFDPEDTNSHRRSVYRFIVRSQPNPFMTTLDCADSSQSTPKRNETLTALQALSLLNNKFTLTMASHFAARLQKDAPDLPARIDLAHQLLTGRKPAPDEAKLLATYAQQHGMNNLCRALFNLSEFTFLD